MCQESLWNIPGYFQEFYSALVPNKTFLSVEISVDTILYCQFPQHRIARLPWICIDRIRIGAMQNTCTVKKYYSRRSVTVRCGVWSVTFQKGEPSTRYGEGGIGAYPCYYWLVHNRSRHCVNICCVNSSCVNNKSFQTHGVTTVAYSMFRTLPSSPSMHNSWSIRHQSLPTVY